MVGDVLSLLAVQEGGVYVDTTVGSGGHAAAILGRLGGTGRLLAIDRDPVAVERAAKCLGAWAGQCVFRQGNFADLAAICAEADFGEVDGVLMDLGLSSDQLAEAERGFSFGLEGPLDMRMNRVESERTASDLVNTLSEETLEELLVRFGEERAARRIVRRIVRFRERHRIRSTTELAELVCRAKGRGGRIHPATKTFQALRMAVNDEIPSLRCGLEAAIRVLRPGGRVAVLAFHSIEDREVKWCFKRHAGKWESQPAGGRRWVAEGLPLRIITKKPATPAREELAANPRSRSAKLRVAERLEPLVARANDKSARAREERRS